MISWKTEIKVKVLKEFKLTRLSDASKRSKFKKVEEKNQKQAMENLAFSVSSSLVAGPREQNHHIFHGGGDLVAT